MVKKIVGLSLVAVVLVGVAVGTVCRVRQQLRQPRGTDTRRTSSSVGVDKQTCEVAERRKDILGFGQYERCAIRLRI